MLCIVQWFDSATTKECIQNKHDVTKAYTFIVIKIMAFALDGYSLIPTRYEEQAWPKENEALLTPMILT